MNSPLIAPLPSGSFYPPGIVGKKRDHRILDPLFFSGKIRKNRKNSEKYFFPKKLGKIRKNSEKYFEKFGKIL